MEHYRLLRVLLDKHPIEPMDLKEKLEELRERLSGGIDLKLVAKLVREDRRHGEVSPRRLCFYYHSPDAANS